MYPHHMTFVHALMREFRKQGLVPTVVAPEERFVISRYPSTWLKNLRPPPLSDSFEGIEVIRPVYHPLIAKTLSRLKASMNLQPGSFSRAAMKATRYVSCPPLFCYGHHLYPGGVGALALADYYAVPSVVVLGASLESNERQFGRLQVGKYLRKIDHIIAVSDAIKEQCTSNHGIEEDKIAVFPNGFVPEMFHPIDRQEARKGLGLPLSGLILAFVGRFVDGKGPLRVLEAIKNLEGIHAVFLGEGPQRVAGSQVLHAGPVPHWDIPRWLAASDAFVLPTISEGSCNAIIEAMACGIPIITSDIASNREILDSTTAILVDPRSVDQIREAVVSLIEDVDRRVDLGQAALRRSSRFRLDTRAKDILVWLNDRGVLSLDDLKGVAG